MYNYSNKSGPPKPGLTFCDSNAQETALLCIYTFALYIKVHFCCLFINFFFSMKRIFCLINITASSLFYKT